MFGVLYTLLVNKFYKVNAGFFLFLALVLFGILPAADTLHLHRGLMLAATSSVTGVGIASCIILLYASRCLFFTLRELSLPELTFLHNMQALKDPRQLLYLGMVFSCTYLPLFIYAGITAWLGLTQGNYIYSLLLLLILLTTIIICTYIIFRRINGTYKESKLKLPDFDLPEKGYYSFLLHYSIHEKKGVLVAIKFFSILALQLLVALNADKASKENICFLMMLCISAHALLPVHYTRFIEGQMPFLRNMPLTLLRRYSLPAFSFAVIFLPELLFLLWNEKNIIPISTILSLYLLAITRLLLYYSIQYLPRMSTERFTMLVFFMFFASMILLASLPLWLFIIIESIISILLFYTLYYKYEPSALTEQ